MEMLGRLDLDDDLLVDDHVQRLPRQRIAPIVHHHGDLTLDAMGLGYEIALQGQSVNELPISKPKLAMNVAKGIEDRARYCSVEERRPLGIHSDNLGPVPLRHRHQTTSEIIRRLQIARTRSRAPVTAISVRWSPFTNRLNEVTGKNGCLRSCPFSPVRARASIVTAGSARVDGWRAPHDRNAL